MMRILPARSCRRWGGRVGRELLAQDPRRHLVDLAALQVAKLEWAVGNADQTRTGQAEIAMTRRISRSGLRAG